MAECKRVQGGRRRCCNGAAEAAVRRCCLPLCYPLVHSPPAVPTSHPVPLLRVFWAAASSSLLPFYFSSPDPPGSHIFHYFPVSSITPLVLTLAIQPLRRGVTRAPLLLSIRSLHIFDPSHHSFAPASPLVVHIRCLRLSYSPHSFPASYSYFQPPLPLNYSN
ncbi:hypothetical protein DFH06DRAFT_143168 [Mycena polygramma]|nr:hypothetical protein DFH06DRAFT_143168 [Mycena polygramma]